MSGTQPTPEVKATNNVIAVVQTGSQLVAALETANPALYAQLVGSLSTYSRSALAPFAGLLVGWAVAHWGLSPYLGTETQEILTNALACVGASAAALGMHWIGKRPGVALQASPPEAK